MDSFGRFVLCLCGVVCASFSVPSASADEIRFASRRDWQAWPLPGTVELTPQGGLKPIAARRNINAALNAADFGGGIRQAGSNLGDAPLVMDGDLATGWHPHLDDPPGSWTIEVDLGRGVSAHRVKLIFDPQGPAPALFDLLLSTGEHAVDEVDNPIAGTVIYRQRERFKENTRHEITYELDQSFHTPIQYVRLDLLALEPNTRLLEVEVEALGDNLALGTLERGGNLEVVLDAFVTQDLIPLGNARVLIDGDLSTRWFVRRTIQAERDVFSHIILDLGATYFVDRLKIVGGVVARPGGGITAGSGRVIDFFITRRSFGFNFYEVLGSDGAVAPDGTLIWQKYYSGTANDYVKQVTGAATHEFGLVPTRFIRVLWKSWDASNRWAFRGFAEELQVFGEGFPQNLEFRSHIMDFQSPKSLNDLSWEADIPPDTRLEIRSRSGNEVENLLTYYDKNGKEVTERRYNKLIPSFKGPIDTSRVIGGDWSAWSKLYAFSGQEFQSPSPRRYAQLQMRMVTEDPSVALQLDALSIAFSDPLSQQAVSEIFPTQVLPGEETEFRFFLRPRETRASGFDRLVVETPTSARFIRALVNDAPLEVEDQPVEAGFAVTFPQPLRDNDLVELRFAAQVFQQSTPFVLFIQDARTEDASRQRVDPGDATDQVASSTNVVGLPVARDLLLNVVFDTEVLTPNGDGINDVLAVRADVINILEPRPWHLRLYDLTGYALVERSQAVTAGAQDFTWDGRDRAGQLVPPGLYLLELHLDGDAHQQRVRRVISVVY
ncbi:MAG: hypothetical protein F4X17_25645 [Gemmatimonadetes bacterium]|nr:hypothetical protein [Gemmatimonadota bacterium]